MKHQPPPDYDYSEFDMDEAHSLITPIMNIWYG